MEEVENVRVVARVRPLSSTEVGNRCRSVVDTDSINGSIYVFKPNVTRSMPKCFNFDIVFGAESKQVRMSKGKII